MKKLLHKLKKIIFKEKNIILGSIVLFILSFLMINYHPDKGLSKLEYLNPTLIWMTWLSFYIFFTYITHIFFLDIPYSWFLDMRTCTKKNTDFFSSPKVEFEEEQREDNNKIFINVVPQAEEYSKNEKELQILKDRYVHLIKFWYGQKNYIFKIRYYFPILISFASVLYFFFILNFLIPLEIPDINKMAIMTISLFVLYATMSYHITSLLDSKFYMQNIMNRLNKIYFYKHEYRQQLKLFLDKNFLVYIHDKIHDTHFCVNEDKDFQDFIAREKSDDKGKDLIVTAYISLFIILFIQISTKTFVIESTNNRGVSCIEIPMEVSKEGLSIVYNNENKTCQIRLSKKGEKHGNQ